MRKNILITGATSGIGLAIAQTFAKQNYGVIITGRRAERLKEIKLELEKLTTAPIQTLCFDVRDKEQIASAIKTIDSIQFPEINILVNNAGLASGLNTIQEGEFVDWDTMIDTNVKGLLYMSKITLPLMPDHNSHIINIGSIAGKTVYAKGNVYCATKFAVDAISQAMRIDLLPKGIKVTSINPGAVETEFSLVRFKGDEEKAKAVYDGFKPLSAQDVADTAFYAATLPPHVCINDITMTCITQATPNNSIKLN
jgi:3-hydroxy acid dehydrogenase / malonic semialdehyde reductase